MTVTFPIIALGDGEPTDPAWFADITEAVNDHETRVSALETAGWITYTPAWTTNGGGQAINNGTLTGQYRRTIGSDIIVAQIYFRAGSTTTFGTGFWTLGLPFPAASNSILFATGTAYFFDTGTITRSGNCRLLLDPAVPSGPGNAVILDHPTLGPITNTVPHTWANTDILSAQIQYQPA